MTLNGAGAYLSDRLSLVFAVSIVAGLTAPFLDQIPSTVISCAIAAQIFLSSFKMAFDDFRELPYLRLTLLVVVRFLVLPVLLFSVTKQLLPSYAIGVLLVALVPAGITTTSFANLFKANVGLAVLAVITTSLLSLASLPLLFRLFGESNVVVDNYALLRSLLLLIVVPFLVHIPFRLVPATRLWFTTRNQLLMVIMLVVTTAAPMAKNRSYLFASPSTLALSAALAALFYLIAYVTGWTLGWLLPYRDRLALALAGGVNNVLLGVVLALLHFDRATSAFLVVCHLVWFVALIPFKQALVSRRAVSDLSETEERAPA